MIRINSGCVGPLVVAALCGACATPRPLGPGERLLHQRVLLGAGGPGEPALAVAELAWEDGLQPRLEALRLDPTGAATLLAAATPAEAASALAAVTAGARLEAVLPASILAAARGYSGELEGAAAAAGATSWGLGEPLAGWRLSLEPAADRYGEASFFLLRDGRGDSARIVHRLARGAGTAVSVRLVSPLLAAATVRWTGEAGLEVSDVVPLELGAAAGELHELHAMQAYERQDWGTALLELARAERLAPTTPSIPYNIACVLSRAGRSNEALAPLRRAVRLSPLEYRMRARTDVDLKPLRGTPGFEELVAPRPLVGTDRVTAAPRAPPSGGTGP